MANPKLSVVAAHPSAEACLSSQTFSEFELVIRDSWNAALADARADFIAFIEPGQTWLPGKLEKQLAKFAAEPFLDWCYCADVAPPDTLRRLILGNFISPGSVMARRSALNELGGFDDSPDITGSEDWDLWLRLAGAYAVGVVPEPLVAPAQRKTISIEQQYASRKAVIERAVARDPYLKDLRSDALAEICIAAGSAYLLANRKKEARECFAEALTHNPLRSDAYVNWMFSYDLYNLSRRTQSEDRVSVR